MPAPEAFARVKIDQQPAACGRQVQDRGAMNDHIIRSQRDLEAMCAYIRGNPDRWELDYEFMMSIEHFCSIMLNFTDNWDSPPIKPDIRRTV
jgi:hypothetical protein